MSMTEEQIERIEMVQFRTPMLPHENDRGVWMSELKRLARLGLALDTSGLTIENLGELMRFTSGSEMDVPMAASAAPEPPKHRLTLKERLTLGCFDHCIVGDEVSIRYAGAWHSGPVIDRSHPGVQSGLAFVEMRMTNGHFLEANLPTDVRWATWAEDRGQVDGVVSTEPPAQPERTGAPPPLAERRKGPVFDCCMPNDDVEVFFYGKWEAAKVTARDIMGLWLSTPSGNYSVPKHLIRWPEEKTDRASVLERQLAALREALDASMRARVEDANERAEVEQKLAAERDLRDDRETRILELEAELRMARARTKPEYVRRMRRIGEALGILGTPGSDDQCVDVAVATIAGLQEGIRQRDEKLKGAPINTPGALRLPPELFEKHPLPWTVGHSVGSIVDAKGRPVWNDILVTTAIIAALLDAVNAQVSRG